MKIITSVNRLFIWGLTLSLITGCEGVPITLVGGQWFGSHEFLFKDVREVNDSSVHQYLVLFEIDLNPGTQDWRLAYSIPRSAQINLKRGTPVIKVHRRAIDSLTQTGIDHLSDQCLQQMDRMVNWEEVSEVVIQATWLPASQTPYFQFVSALRAKLAEKKIKLGAVIPLTYLQFRNEIGIPPVDFGIVNLYSPIQLQSLNEQGKLLGRNQLDPYLMNFSDYPLSLRVMVPGPIWAIIVRDKKPLHVLPTVSREELNETEGMELLEELIVRINRPIYFHGIYLQEGDIMRLEQIVPKDYEDLMNRLISYLPGGRTELIFNGGRELIDLSIYQD